MEAKPLAGQVAIVTGGGTGIGKAMALTFAGNGATVAIAGRRKEALRETLDEIEAGGGTAMMIPMDVGDMDQCAALVHNTVERFGRLDILVNNATARTPLTQGPKLLVDTPLEAWDLSFAVNVKGPFVLCREAIPFLRRQEKSHIVNLISMAARQHLPKAGLYVSTKNAMRSLSIVLSKELRQMETGIQVHLINPGGTLTEPMQRSIESGHRADLRGTKMMTPQDIADIALFLVTRPGNSVIDEVNVRRSDATYFGI